MWSDHRSNVLHYIYLNLNAEASISCEVPEITTLSLPRISCTANAISDRGFGGGPPPEEIIMIPLASVFIFANNNNYEKHTDSVLYIKLDAVGC